MWRSSSQFSVLGSEFPKVAPVRRFKLMTEN
jgi:hypothetical protein